MQLSKHFKLIEFTKSMTATRKGIKNEPGAGDIKNLGDVCYEILEPVRANFDKPITGVHRATAARRYVKRSAAKKRRNTRRARRLTLKSSGIPNIKVAYWLTKQTCDFDQCNIRILQTR